MCADSREYLPKIPPESVDLIPSDIPDGMGQDEWDVLHSNANSAYLGSSSAQERAGKVFSKRRKPINCWSSSDGSIGAEYYDWCRSWTAEWLRLLKPGGSAFVFCGRRLSHRCVVHALILIPLLGLSAATANAEETAFLESSAAPAHASELHGDHKSLTDNQLQILNYFLGAVSAPRSVKKNSTAAEAAAQAEDYKWKKKYWERPRDPNQSHQMGIDAYRYQLAFPAYTIAALASVHTPAYPGLAERMLRDIFARMVAYQVWEYWDTPGVCSNILKPICPHLHLSYCDVSWLTESEILERQQDIASRLQNPEESTLQELIQLFFSLIELSSPGTPAPIASNSFSEDDSILPPRASAHAHSYCPDPVHRANIMYSAHLAQIGALYELFSDEISLTTEGWVFKGRRHGNPDRPLRYFSYTLPQLIDRLRQQQHTSHHGGFACEPGQVFNPCNIHAYSAERLYDAIHNTDYYTEYNANRWMTFLDETAVRKNPKGVFNESYWETLYVPLFGNLPNENSPWLDFFPGLGIPGGQVANDGWVTTWLYSIVPPDVPLYLRLNEATEMMDSNRAWRSDKKTGGRYIKANKLVEKKRYSSALATSFYTAVGSNESKRRDAKKYMNGQYGRHRDTDEDGVMDAYYYRQTDGMTNWVTANMALGESVKAEQLHHLYGSESPVLVARREKQPVLDHIKPSEPRLLVRRAFFDPDLSALEFTLTAPSAVLNAKAVVTAPEGIGEGQGWVVREVQVNGQTSHNWRIKKSRVVLHSLEIPGEWRDTSFTVFLDPL